MTIKSKDFMIKAEELKKIYAKVSKLWKEESIDDCMQTHNALWSPVEVFLLSMPAEVGGGPLLVVWSEEDARQVAGMLDMSDENERRANYGLGPLSDFVIQPVMLSALAGVERIK